MGSRRRPNSPNISSWMTKTERRWPRTGVLTTDWGMAFSFVQCADRASFSSRSPMVLPPCGPPGGITRRREQEDLLSPFALSWARDAPPELSAPHNPNPVLGDQHQLLHPGAPCRGT